MSTALAILLNAVTASGAGAEHVISAVNGYAGGEHSFEVTGTFVADIAIEARLESGGAWKPLGTISAPDFVSYSGTFYGVRGNVTSYTSGTITLKTRYGITDLSVLEGRLTSARAGYIDELSAANLPADIDTLLSRLTVARSGYLDELAPANIPADIDTLLARFTATRAAYIDNLLGHVAQTGDSYPLSNGANGFAAIKAETAELLLRLTAARAGFIDQLSATSLPADIATLVTRLTAERAAALDNLDGKVSDIKDLRRLLAAYNRL